MRRATRGGRDDSLTDCSSRRSGPERRSRSLPPARASPAGRRRRAAADPAGRVHLGLRADLRPCRVQRSAPLAPVEPPCPRRRAGVRVGGRLVTAGAPGQEAAVCAPSVSRSRGVLGVLPSPSAAALGYRGQALQRRSSGCYLERRERDASGTTLGEREKNESPCLIPGCCGTVTLPKKPGFGPAAGIWQWPNGGPPADLLINQGARDNVSGHTSRAPPGRVRTDNQTVPALCHNH